MEKVKRENSDTSKTSRAEVTMANAIPGKRRSQTSTKKGKKKETNPTETVTSQTTNQEIDVPSQEQSQNQSLVKSEEKKDKKQKPRSSSTEQNSGGKRLHKDSGLNEEINDGDSANAIASQSQSVSGKTKKVSNISLEVAQLLNAYAHEYVQGKQSGEVTKASKQFFSMKCLQDPLLTSIPDNFKEWKNAVKRANSNKAYKEAKKKTEALPPSPVKFELEKIEQPQVSFMLKQVSENDVDFQETLKAIVNASNLKNDVIGFPFICATIEIANEAPFTDKKHELFKKMIYKDLLQAAGDWLANGIVDDCLKELDGNQCIVLLNHAMSDACSFYFHDNCPEKMKSRWRTLIENAMGMISNVNYVRGFIVSPSSMTAMSRWKNFQEDPYLSTPVQLMLMLRAYQHQIIQQCLNVARNKIADSQTNLKKENLTKSQMAVRMQATAKYTNIIINVQQVLKDYFGYLSSQSLGYITDEPNKLLQYDVLEMLSSVAENYRERIIQVIYTIAEDECVDTKLQQMLQKTQDYRWIWSKIGSKIDLSSQTMTSVFNAFRDIQRLPISKIEYLYKVEGEDPLEVLKHIAQHTCGRKNFDRKQENLLDKNVLTIVNADETLKELYEECVQLSLDVVRQGYGKKFYSHSTFQCMIAAQIAKSVIDGRDSYTHLNPGTGKSFCIMLAAKLLRNRGYDQEIIIMTLNNVLLNQLRVCAANFDLINKVSYRTDSSWHAIDNTALLFYDEYYHALLSAKLTTDLSGKVVNIMGIANYGYRRILLGGTSNQHFREIISLLVPDIVLHDKYPSQFGMIGQQAINQVDSVVAASEKELEELIYRDIVATAPSTPVLIFGMDNYSEPLSKVMGAKKVMQIETETEVEDLKREANNFTCGVFLLDFAWHFGTDIRFGITPSTFMFCPKKRYSNYTILQMAGRSQRGLQRSTSALYWVSTMPSDTGLQQELATPELAPFKAGPQVLKEMLKMATPKVGENDDSVLHETFQDDEWILDWKDFVHKWLKE